MYSRILAAIATCIYCAPILAEPTPAGTIDLSIPDRPNIISIADIALSPDGLILAIGVISEKETGHIFLYDVRMNKLIATLNDDSKATEATRISKNRMHDPTQTNRLFFFDPTLPHLLLFAKQDGLMAYDTNTLASRAAISDKKGFWGSLDRSCWATTTSSKQTSAVYVSAVYKEKLAIRALTCPAYNFDSEWTYKIELDRKIRDYQFHVPTRQIAILEDESAEKPSAKIYQISDAGEIKFKYEIAKDLKDVGNYRFVRFDNAGEHAVVCTAKGDIVTWDSRRPREYSLFPLSIRPAYDATFVGEENILFATFGVDATGGKLCIYNLLTKSVSEIASQDHQRYANLFCSTKFNLAVAITSDYSAKIWKLDKLLGK